MKKILPLLFLCIFSLAVGKTLHFLKNGFSPRRIQPLNHWTDVQWDEEAKKALEQPFFYLGRGCQAFAFISEDQKYVLKLPRTDILKIPFWLRVLPLKANRESLLFEKKKKEEFLRTSFVISLNELKNQTGLLAIHLGTSPSEGKKLLLIDQLGCRHHLPLEKTPFLLQYYQPILIDAFQAALKKGKREEAENILDSLLEVIAERASKGILNRDRFFLENFGYDGKKGYQIDVGSFFKNPHLQGIEASIKSFYDSIAPIQEWLSETEPQMLSHFQEKVKSLHQLRLLSEASRTRSAEQVGSDKDPKI